MGKIRIQDLDFSDYIMPLIKQNFKVKFVDEKPIPPKKKDNWIGKNKRVRNRH